MKLDTFRNIRSLKTLNPYIWRYRKLFLWGIVFVAVSNVFAVWPAQMVRHAFDAMKGSFAAIHQDPAAANSIRRSVLYYSGLIVGMALLKGFFMFLMRQTIIVMSRHIEYDMKNDVYAHFQKLSLAYYRRHNTGDLMARITEDVSRVRMYTGPSIMYFINLASLLLLVVPIMLSVSVKLTLCTVLPLPILAISIYIVNSITYARSMGIQNQLSTITTFVQEIFSGVRVIKSFTAEPSATERFAVEVESYREKSMGLVKVDSMFFPLILFLIGLSTLITLYVGGLEVIAGRLTIGVLAEFFIYLSMLSWPVASLGWTTSLVQRAAASQARINELLHAEPEIVSGTEPIRLRGDIKFDHVSFVYPDTGIQALRNISFHIKAGQSLGVIGRTGSGKSTLAQLLLRSYDITEGRVLVDDKDIRSLDLGSYREQIGYVPQDDFLFSDTIANNILFASHARLQPGMPHRHKPTAEEEEVLMRSATLADVWKDISGFPDGFETMLGERGITLSGGQKQRVGISRAIACDPQFLILDDCFSAVDTNTEAQILQNLATVMQNKTSVIISHRVSTVKNATHIIVLDAGRIIEEGNHEQLMDKQGYYYMLYQKQLVEKELYEREKDVS